jgi:glycosyltransferase involved in cell wall biosynthesis
MPPLVTVLMPVYNGERFLREAVESILTQTLTDFEFLIIDDGSTDTSGEIIRSYADPRIRFESNGVNLGLVPTLNRGLNLARGAFVARMDVDDVSLPERLARQAAFLSAHPDIGVVGAAFQRVDGDGRRGKVIRHPTEPGVILWHLFFLCPLGHPTVMMRTALVVEAGGYRTDMREAEDYELWARLRTRTRLANLPTVLVLYRDHPASKSLRGADQVGTATAQVAQALIAETLGEKVPLEQIRRLQDYQFGSLAQLLETARLMYRLWRAFEARQPLTPKERLTLRAHVARRGLGLLRRAAFRTALTPGFAARR